MISTPRSYVLISIPAELAAAITVHLEAQRAGRPGLRVDLPAWIRAAARLQLAAEQAGQSAPKAQQPTPKAEQLAPRTADPTTPQAPAATPAPKSPWADAQDDQDQDDAEDQDRDDQESSSLLMERTHRRGGYVHPRTRREMFAEGARVGIPEVVLKHYTLLRDGIKPTTLGFQTTEDLLAKVEAARAAGQDPAPLWARWVPAPAAQPEPPDLPVCTPDTPAPPQQAAHPGAVSRREQELARLICQVDRGQVNSNGVRHLKQVAEDLLNHYRAWMPAAAPEAEPAWAAEARRVVAKWPAVRGRVEAARLLEQLLRLLPAPAAAKP